MLADFVPHIIQEIRYYFTYNFVGKRIDGYEEPVALLSIEAARALKAVSNELLVQGYRRSITSRRSREISLARKGTHHLCFRAES